MFKIFSILALLSPVSVSAGNVDVWAERGKFIAQTRKAAEEATAISTAKIIRGATPIEIDFTKPEDVKKIKNNDVIELGEGRYTSFGDLKASGVTMKGQGRLKTYIAGNKGEEIRVNDTAIWDVTLIDPSFRSPGEGTVTIVHANLIGNIYSEPYKARLQVVLTETTGKEAGGSPFFVAYHLVDRTLENRFQYAITAVHSIDGTGDTDIWQVANYSMAAMRGDTGTFIDDKMIEKLTKAYPKLLKVYASSLANARNGLRIASHYFRTQFNVKLEGDEAEYKKLTKEAAAAKQSGNMLIASALYSLADVASAFNHHSELKKSANTLLNELRNKTACTGVEPSGNAVPGMPGLVFESASSRYPYLSYLGTGKGCTLTIRNWEDGTNKKIDTYQKLGTTTEQVETEESRQRRAKVAAEESATARAAERAGAKARRARMEAAGESMKQVTDKAAAGRFRVEDGATGKTMVYGQGDFSGHANADTKSAYENNQAEANRLRGDAAAIAANAPEREMKTIERETGDRFVGDFKVIKAEAEIAGAGKREKVVGGDFNYGAGSQCSETSGGGQIKKTDCRATFSNPQAYVNGAFVGAFEKFLKANVVASMYPKAKAKIASKDPATRAEGLLLNYIYGGAATNAAADFPGLTEKLFGRKLSFAEVMGSAIYFK